MLHQKRTLRRCALISLVLTLSVTLMPGAFAADLMQVYQDALQNDPAFKVARATWQATRAALYVSRAGVLPQLLLSAHADRVRVKAEGGGGSVSYSSPYGYGLSIQQPLFNVNAWMRISESAVNVKRAYADYAAAAEDLMLRTAAAYLSVLEAHDVLNFTQLEKKAVAQELEQTEARYKAGLTAITAFYDAKARYDTISANEIASKNTLKNQIEGLYEITGRYYQKLSGLNQHVKAASPNPIQINQWVRAAEKQNYALKAARLAALAAHEGIRVSQTARFPVLNARGSLNVERGGNSSTVVSSSSKVALVGLSVDFPIYQGGRVNAQTHEAQYNYQRFNSEAERIHRAVVGLARKAYLGIVSGVSKIKADKQVITSRQSALEGDKASYTVGTRTIVDVLDSQANLSQAKINYKADLYRYLVNTLNLKEAAGTLSPDDLAGLNHWLTQPILLAP